MNGRQEVLERAKINIIKAQQKQKEAYDKKHTCPDVYKVGSLVLKKDFTRKKRKGGKLDAKWLGPFRVMSSLGRGLYRLKAVDSEEVIPRVNGVHLKHYNVRGGILLLCLTVFFFFFLQCNIKEDSNSEVVVSPPPPVPSNKAKTPSLVVCYCDNSIIFF